jgi:peptidoglycan pentaglycine glycine transferase (the first glycine)
MMNLFDLGEKEWDDAVSEMEGAHILQSWTWGEFKGENGWDVERFIWKNRNGKPTAIAQILQRSIKFLGFGFQLRILYVPKGPILSNWTDVKLQKEVLDDLKKYAKEKRAIFIKIDPDLVIDGEGLDDFADEGNFHGKKTVKQLQAGNWQFSKEQIQFKNTVWLDLKPTDDDLLGKMKQKTRYNLKLAVKKGVEVRTALKNELPILYHLYALTSARDGFIIRPEKYYLSIWEKMMNRKRALGLIAYVENQPVAGLILFYFGRKAWYFYGMSSEQHRDKMPNYLLQWEAIRKAKQLGCEIYDLWGAPNLIDEQDPLWGVFRFKQGLGGKLICTIGAWDYPQNKFVYNIYTDALPRYLSIIRKFRSHAIQANLNNEKTG